MENENKNKHAQGIQINEISEKTKVSFRTRVITALVLVAVCFPCLIFGNWAFAAIGLVVSCVATYEFIHVLSKQKHFLWIDIFTFIMTISFMYWFMIKNQLKNGSILDENGWIMFSDIGISTLGIAFMICVVFLGAMLTKRFSVSDACYFITMSILISLGMQSLHFLRFVPVSGIGNIAAYKYEGNYLASCVLFFYFGVGTCFTDIGAYAVGILFGKHKMNPRISPNKTWEGFFGGIVISFLVSFAFGMILSSCGFPLIKGLLDVEHWYWILLVSIVMPFASVMGDFIFSAIKRHYEIKDFSNILPGHGGVLDRIDSILVSGMVVTILILTIANFPFIS